MEFLRTCNTNAQAIGDFEAVAYQAFSVKRSPTTPPVNSDERVENPEDLHAVEESFRQGNHLVVQDGGRSWLWFFRPTTPDRSGQIPAASPVLDGFAFHAERSGVVKAADLARYPGRPISMNTSASAATSNSPSTQSSYRAAQTSNLRAAQANAQIHMSFTSGGEQQQQSDIYTIYELFMSAIIALLSYYLARDHNVIPLNYRTFISFSTAEPQAEIEDSTIPGLSAWLTGMDVHWTSGGSVVVSTSSFRHPEIRRISSSLGEEAQENMVSKYLRIAPNGILARLVEFEDSLITIDENEIRQGQHKRPKIRNFEEEIRKWKIIVIRWLKSKGISLSRQIENKAWVKIQIAQDVQPTSMDQTPSLPTHSREVLWPAPLCFFYESCSNASNNLNAHVTQQADGEGRHQPYSSSDRSLDWFQTPDSTGFRDPLDLAQQWFSGKAERAKVQKARRKTQQAEVEAAQAHVDATNLYPSSPLYSRTGVYGDLQAVSGVYPTPPDGIVSQGQGGSSSIDVPSVSGPTANIDGILAQAGNQPSLGLPGPLDIDSTTVHDLPGSSPEMHHTFDSQQEMHFDTSLHDANDDLFEDMDEDVFGGTGVTEADFNFFDEPDGAEFEDMIEMTRADAPPADVSMQPKLQDSPAQEHNVKKEPSLDPEPSLADAAPSDTQLKNENNHDSEIFQLSDMEAIIEPEIADHSDSKPMDLDEPAATRQEIEEIVFSPPLSPHLIKQKLLPSPTTDISPNAAHRTLAGSTRRESIFDPVSFNRKISLSDSKYSDGRFSFPTQQATKSPLAQKESKMITAKDRFKLSQADIPKTSTPQRLSLLKMLRGSTEESDAHQTHPVGISLDGQNADESDTSDQYSGDFSSEDELPSAVAESVSAGQSWPSKRKWVAEENATPSATPLSASSFGETKTNGENQDFAVKRSMVQTDDQCLTWFEPSPWDWSLADLPSTELPSPTFRNDLSFSSPGWPPKPQLLASQADGAIDSADEKPTLSGKDTIAVAQIITDQIVLATLDILQEDNHSHEKCDTSNEGPLSPGNLIQTVVKELFSKTVDCDLLKYATIQDIFPDISQASKGQPRAIPRRTNGPYGQGGDGAGSLGHLLYPIGPPHIRVRRADALWDLLPPALSFWEPLGLAPTSGPKNIVTYCIYPHSETLGARVENFLDNIGIVYEGCKLGNHIRGDSIAGSEAGLVPSRMSSPVSMRAALRTVRDTCVQLGKALASSYSEVRDKDEAQKIDAFVVYMVDPFETPAALWELCSAFWFLFQAYGQGAKARADYSPNPDLVLQIVPMKYIASFDAPVVLEPWTLINLAREVYDRCPPSQMSEDKTPLSIYSAPSIQLEEALPRSIQFKLTAEPPSDLLRENSYMHLGYAISLDGAWISAAWSDNCGKHQTVVSYCVGSRAFSEIAREIWQTTIEIIETRRVTWRVCIAKAGVMEREELEAWVSLASSPTKLNLFTTLIAVDTSPALTLTPTITSVSTCNSSANPASSTPVSTPQPGVSPDQHGLTPAATPSDLISDPSADPDARLIDITDETWGIVLSHRLHNSHSAVEYRPALISGLLVKRGDSSATTSPSQPSDLSHGPIVIGINILWVGAIGGTRAGSSPFNSPATSDGVSPGGMGMQGSTERSSNSMSWTSTAQSRATAENLLKEVLSQFRGLGLLARLKGMRGSKHGAVPWHVAAALRAVRGMRRCM